MPKELSVEEMLQYVEDRRYMVSVYWHNHFLIPFRKKVDEGIELSREEKFELLTMYKSIQYVKDKR